ncbi:MAG: hypothetical protein U0031_09630 [Thermomicrobiales bacterium]
MHESRFDEVTRHASVLADRRGSLKALGSAAVLAALPFAPETAKAGRKKKKQCVKDAVQCANSFATFCNGEANPDGCNNSAAQCCANLKTCDTARAISCIISTFLLP